MRLIAFLTEPPSIRTILAHLGEPTTPPVLAPRARAPPDPEAEPIGSLGFASRPRVVSAARVLSRCAITPDAAKFMRR